MTANIQSYDAEKWSVLPSVSIPEAYKRASLILIRGLPGSGKSTLAKLLANCISAVHYEADMYFTRENGEYQFDRTKLSKAHNWCKDSVEDAMTKGLIVIVSNTFTADWEIEPYKRLCKKHNYPMSIIHMQTEHHNVHNVPDDVISNMRKRMKTNH